MLQRDSGGTIGDSLHQEMNHSKADLLQIAPNSTEENAAQSVTIEERLEALEAAMLEMALKEVEE